jgi:glycerol-3-phosphate dehydrogenase
LTTSLHLDVVIFGGGAAGLWLLDELVRAGYSVLLLEAHELGSGQTIASQGIIHGGLKYTLSGWLTPSARAIRDMPVIWRRCLAGEARPDLSGTRLRAQFCHLWRTHSLKSRLAMIGAKAGLQVAPVTLADQERPAVLAECPGAVARLDEQVIEPASFLADLSWQHRDRLLKIDATHGQEFDLAAGGLIRSIRLINSQTGQPLDLAPQAVVLTAGEGNAHLRTTLRLDPHIMQRRPLHMVMVRGPAESLPVLNAHCVDGAKTRVTITTTEDLAGRAIWQIGGQLAEDGVGMEPAELVAHAIDEMRHVLPSLSVTGLEWATHRVDRAEPATRSSRRPDDAVAVREGQVITAWPTKLALVPHLTAMICTMLPPPGERRFEAGDEWPEWPRPIVALPPWEVATRWYAGA